MATALVAALSMLGAGCSLLLDFDNKADAGPQSDATAFDAGGVEGDGGDGCSSFEPNNDISTAVTISDGTTAPLGICPAGDRDFYKFTLTGGQDTTIIITFDNMGGSGDLEMRLYNGIGAVVESSNGFGNSETITRAAGTQLAAGDYIIEVFGFTNNVENAYSLELTITTP